MNEQFDRQNEAGVRLNKWIAESGFCSRREADRLISEGKVTIDGRTGVLGDKVLPGMKVRVDGREAVVKTKKVYIALNKPAGVVCTADPREPMNVVDYVGHPERIFPIGRLDKDSEGLLLFTNDGDLGHRLTSPKHRIEKEYYAETDGTIDEADVQAFLDGIPLKDGTVCLSAGLKRTDGGCLVTVQEGKYHQVRRMLASRGKPVTYLRRIREGNLCLGDLEKGAWRPLTPEEICGLL